MTTVVATVVAPPQFPRLSVIAYRLPLRRPWRSAHVLRRERCGWLVRAELDGLAGYGDCAPLPEAGTETAEAARDRLEEWCRQAGSSPLAEQLDLLAGATRLRRGSAAVAEDQPVRPTALSSATPAADAALETALLDLDARRQRITLRARLLRDAPLFVPIPLPAVLPVNAALGAVTDCRPSALDMALSAGYSVLKLKVGVAPRDDEIRGLQALCDLLPPAVRLRLDANQAWSPAEAQQLLELLEPLSERIESLEEPLRPDPELTRHDAVLRALQAQAAFSIALDESLSARGWPPTFADLPVRRLVLKPAVLGGLRSTLALAQAAQSAGLEVVVTSLIESAAGLWASAQLAAAIGSPLAHGLATSDWLAADLGGAPTIEHGQLWLGETAGSGFTPSPSMHSRFA